MLKRLQNCFTRSVMWADHRAKAPPMLKKLHWLPFEYHIDFKVSVVTCYMYCLGANSCVITVHGHCWMEGSKICNDWEQGRKLCTRSSTSCSFCQLCTDITHSWGYTGTHQLLRQSWKAIWSDDKPKKDRDTFIKQSIKIDDTVLNAVEKFCYLGSVLSQDIDDDITKYVSAASASFGWLQSRLWNECGISVKTKIDVYCAVVVTTLLYGCESWMTYRRHIRKLDRFHMKCLRQLARIKWQQGQGHKYRVIEAVQHIWNEDNDQQVPAEMVWPRCPYARLSDTKAHLLRQA